jgi:hypothetical protein
MERTEFIPAFEQHLLFFFVLGRWENVEQRTSPLRFAVSQPCDAMFH